MKGICCGSWHPAAHKCWQASALLLTPPPGSMEFQHSSDPPAAPSSPPLWVMSYKALPHGAPTYLPPPPQAGAHRPAPCREAHGCQLLSSGCSPARRGGGSFTAGDPPGAPSRHQTPPERRLLLLRNVTVTNGLLHTCHLSSGRQAAQPPSPAVYQQLDGGESTGGARLDTWTHVGTGTQTWQTHPTQGCTHRCTCIHTQAPGLSYTHI